MSRFAVILLLGAVWVCVSRAQLRVSTRDMQNAVRTLEQRFSSIRDEGLGIDSLEDALRVANYASQTLSNEDIEALLLDETLENRVTSILTLFDDITSAVNVASPPDTPAVPALSCCDVNAANASLCVYAVSEENANAAVLDALSGVTLDGGDEVMVGTVDGTIILVPSGESSDCTKPDARLKPWFAAEARQRSNPLEVVILLDLIRLNSPFIDDDTFTLVTDTASLIIKSLTTADMVGLVGIDGTHLIPNVIERIHGSSPPKVVPVCTDTVLEIDAFTTSFTPVATRTSDISYTEAFRTAFSLFSSDASRDKLLLYLGPGLPTGVMEELTDIQAVISTAGSSVDTISVYLAVNADLGNIYGMITRGSNRAIQLAPTPPAPLSSIVGGFYDFPSDRDCADAPVCTVTFGHAGELDDNSLTLRRPLVRNGTFLGVLYATLPFSQLLGTLLTATSGREFSYPFIVGTNQLPLFHPLLPGDSVAQVFITDLEPEGVVAEVLDGTTSSPAAVMKQHLVYTGSTDYHSPIFLTLPSFYHCRELTLTNVVGVASTSLSTCYVLAEGERMLRTLNLTPSEIQEIYQSQSSPIYHRVLETVDPGDRCNYFCKLSTLSQVSFQLTPPSSPAPGYPTTLIPTLTGYIEGRETRPEFVSMGVAEEAALGMAVAEDWLDIDSIPSYYITRRHLATPNGLYLTYPPSHLVSNFEPRLAEWYQAPSAHPSLLTLGTPQINPLREGGRLTVSVGFAVRAPSSPDDLDLGDGGPPLAVVSGDITLDSLRVFVREALPRCEDDPVRCVIVDDSGNLIYEKTTDNFQGVARFFAEEENRRVVLTNLTGLASKRQCTDLFNVVIKTRRFFILDTSSEELFANPPGHCAEYRVQHIPGTNAFLVVYEDRDCSSSVFCSCSSSTCLNCATFTSSFCECPCNCTDDCEPAMDSSFVCPLIVPRHSNYDRVVAEQITAIEPDQPFCFQQLCSCRTDFDSCFGVRDCHWCEEEQKCAHVTECCSVDEGPSCCGSPRELTRLQLYQETCLEFAFECFNHPVLNVTCPTSPAPTSPSPTASSSNTSTIVAAVVGGLVGLILLVLIILLIIYYQVCRKPDPAEASSRESAFDFSNKTAMAVGGEGKGMKSPKRNSESADIEKGIAAEKQEVTPPKDTDETTM